AMARRSRVFPEPDGPSIDRHSDAATSNVSGGSVPTFSFSTLSTMQYRPSVNLHEKKLYQQPAVSTIGLVENDAAPARGAGRRARWTGHRTATGVPRYRR